MKKYIDNFRQYQFLLSELVKKGIKLKYRRSYLGIVWSMLEPLLSMIVLTIVFGTLYGNKDRTFPVYILTGRLLYSFYSQATKAALKSIRANSGMIKKVYVPKYLYPLSAVAYNYVIFLISLLVLAIVSVILGVKPTIYLLQAPVPLLIILLFSYGSGMLLATIGVFFRDIEYLWSVALMMIMYTCAIFYYPSKLLKSGWAWILKFNPLYCIIQIFRSAIFGKPTLRLALDRKSARLSFLYEEAKYMKFNLSREKVDSLKDYIFKAIKGELQYNEFWALRDINFSVEKGDRVGILGLNGAGKSTLLKVISGVFKPTTGSVKKHGKMVPLLELGAGFEPQYTGTENIYLYGSMLGYTKDFIDSKYEEIVKFSELQKFMDVPVKNYSSGMKSRLGFSIATVVEPQILILDEVLSVGDAKFRKKSEKKIMSMFDSGVTVLFVSHSLEQVMRLCNKAMILEKGQLLAYGDIGPIAEQYSQMIN